MHFETNHKPTILQCGLQIVGGWTFALKQINFPHLKNPNLRAYLNSVGVRLLLVEAEASRRSGVAVLFTGNCTMYIMH